VQNVEQPGRIETDDVLVRSMRREDLQRVVAIDAGASGAARPEYFARLVERALERAHLQVSLVAEMEGRVVGFLVGSLFYGEFGVPEASATIDAVGVDPAWRRRHVGRALMRQFRRNLAALRVDRVRTEVRWDDFDLLAFLRVEGFAPAPRVCLERPLDPTAAE
jgi:ribosomal protein S18 acetylase RimI-like enzyme